MASSRPNPVAARCEAIMRDNLGGYNLIETFVVLLHGMTSVSLLRGSYIRLDWPEDTICSKGEKRGKGRKRFRI